MATEYIPIKDRVMVDTRQPAVAAYALVGVDERTGVYRWQGLCVSDHEATCRGAADTARSAIRLACKDVQERCAALVEVEYPSEVPYTMARYLADHIRGLEL